MIPLEVLLNEARLRRRIASPVQLIDRNFPEQALFVEDPSMFIAARCTRRAGKSVGLAYKYFIKAHQHPKSFLPYISLTRDSAKNIMWPILREVNDRYGLGCEFVDHALLCKTRTGAQIKLYGSNTKGLANRLRGIKTPFAAIDEAQSFRPDILSELLDDVLPAAIGDYGESGQLAVTGTPGPTPGGIFYEITERNVGQWSRHQWSVFNNPYFPNPEGFVERIMQARGWDRNHPTVRREYFNEWVPDPDTLCYKYLATRNGIRVFEPILKHTSSGERLWSYVLGVDLGHSPDPSAFSLLAYHPHIEKLFILKSYKRPQMDVTDVAGEVKSFQKQYPNLFVVMDQGGGAKQVVEEIRRRHGIDAIAAEKKDKADYIELMNSDFRTGRIQVVEPECQDLISEWMRLSWDSTSLKKREDPRLENHCTDSVLYPWRWAFHYLSKTPAPKLAADSEESLEQQWIKIQEKERARDDSPSFRPRARRGFSNLENSRLRLK
ncbi:MAG: hypothetical protein E6R03_02280 [Hyphomicrobiaceae bacterium]|nr:MAG: hypothetical protein E6R03_02280 [Hyphomicrobiaceae bacterium]